MTASSSLSSSPAGLPVESPQGPTAIGNGSGSPDAHAVAERDAIELAFRQAGYDLPTHPAHLVRRVHQRATFCFQQALAGEALSPTQFAALATILRMGEVSQNHLGRLTAMDPSTISLVVRKLTRDKLVYRTPSKRDQRLAILRLTEEGTRYTLDRLARSAEVGERLLAPLSRAERGMLLDLLARIADGEDNPPERAD